jgi:hypothetical protein
MLFRDQSLSASEDKLWEFLASELKYMLDSSLTLNGCHRPSADIVTSGNDVGGGDVLPFNQSDVSSRDSVKVGQ